MSTSESTSTTTFQTSGECVVCGTPTSKCCSSCKKSGLDWMFFCSVEHQKLVSILFNLSPFLSVSVEALSLIRSFFPLSNYFPLYRALLLYLLRFGKSTSQSAERIHSSSLPSVIRKQIKPWTFETLLSSQVYRRPGSTTVRLST